MSWQPIETAPRDGTGVDLWVKYTASYNSCYRIAGCFYENGTWLDSEGNEIEFGPLKDGATCKITHWMLPPGPPEEMK